MSWDLYVANIPDSFHKTEDVPRDWFPPILGTGNQLIRRITDAFPSADFGDPEIGHINGNGYSIAVALSAVDNDVDGFMLFVRGNESAAYAVAELVQILGCRAFDTGSDDGTIFPGPDVTKGWRAWRTLRDRALDN